MESMLFYFFRPINVSISCILFMLQQFFIIHMPQFECVGFSNSLLELKLVAKVWKSEGG
jgi:hypothetical protein